MFLQQWIGLGFLMLGFVSLSSYTDSTGLKIQFFYKELQPMQARWGKTVGTLLHLIGYALAPLGFGVIFLLGLVTFQ